MSGSLARMGHSARATLVVVLLAAIFGAVLGAAYSGSRGTSASATVRLALSQDPQPSGDPSKPLSTGGTQDTGSFVQAQLAEVAGGRIETAVRRSLGSEVSISATQVAESSVLELAASARTEADASRAVTQAARLYIAQRRSDELARLDDQAAAVATQLRVIQKQLTAPLKSSLPSVVDQSYAESLQTSYSTYQAVASSIALLRASLPAGATVLGTPVVTSSGTGGALRYAALGALLLGLLALGAVMALRRAGGRLVTGEEIDPAAVRVLHPALPGAGRGWVRQLGAGGGDDSAAQRAAHLNLAQLVGNVSAEHPTSIVVVGVGHGAGASFVAAQFAARLAERVPTLLVCAGDLVTGALAEDLGVPADAIGLTDLTTTGIVDPAALRAAAQTTVVPGVDAIGPGTKAEHRIRRLEELVEHGLLSSAQVAGWSAVVVDAPTLERSMAAAGLARQAEVTVLVAGIGVSRAADVENALRAVEAGGSRVAGVVLDSPSLRARRRPRRAGQRAQSRAGQHSSLSIMLPAADSATSVGDAVHEGVENAVHESRADAGHGR